MLGEYRRSAKIVLLANPGFRDTTYVPAGAVPPEAVPIAAALKGKKLPLVGRIEISVIVEGQAVWLAFVNRELDLLERLPPEFVDEALADGVLRPELAAKGIRHEAQLQPNTRWTYFNMEDPLVGGYPPEKIALRRAIGMGYDVKEFIRVILKGRAVPATSPIPPDIAGYDPLLKTAHNSTIPRRRARCWTGSATRIATATAPAKCRTASRWSSSAGRRRHR